MYNLDHHFHFIGIGGVGMSGIAEVLLSLGFAVTGSDAAASATTERLSGLGADIHIGHDPLNIASSTSLVVFSSAIRPDNVELVAAKDRSLPIVPRAEVLAELMRLKFGIAIGGAHGKTSTTSMVAAVLEKGELDPTVVIGGRVLGRSSGARVGEGKFLVAEADESDRSFLLLRPSIAVITNIDSEHLEAYASYEELQGAFLQYMNAVPFYGLAVVCVDDPVVRSLVKGAHRRVVSYGLEHGADCHAVNVKTVGFGSIFSVEWRGKRLGDINLPLPGRHYCLNALAAVVVGLEVGVPFAKIKEALENFAGVARRSEVLARSRGVTIISDYGHHPTEVKATLRALREALTVETLRGIGPFAKEQQAKEQQAKEQQAKEQQGGRLLVVFQPHRYSRTESCFGEFLKCFDDADELIITDIYAAGEAPRPGISSANLVASIGQSNVRHVAALEDAGQQISALMRDGDTVVFLGAGSVGGFAEGFVRRLEDNFSSISKLCG